jgi:sodium transport system permease protein
MKEVFKIARKEILTYVREERFVLIILVPLVILPLLMHLPILLLARFYHQAESKPQVVAVQGISLELRELLRQNRFTVRFSPDPRHEVREKLADVGIVYEDGRYTIYDSSGVMNLQPSAATERAKAVLQRYKEQVVLARIQPRGLASSDLEPFAIETQKAASEQEQAMGLLALVIPMVVVSLVISGGQAVALEATVGEKEKATIEALLSAPIAPAKLLWGKGLAIFLVAVFSALISSIGVVLGNLLLQHNLAGRVQALPENLQMQIGSLALAPANLLAITLTTLLLAFFAVALMLAVGIFARSYREASTYFGPLDLLMFAPVLFFVLLDYIKVQDWFFVLPGLGVVLALDSIVKGNSSPWQLGLTWLSTLAYGVLALHLAYRNFQREDVVFRN